MSEIDYKKIPGTWAHLLECHWQEFNDVIRRMDDSNGLVPHEKLRAYVLWDMQRRHDEELNKQGQNERMDKH